MSKTIKRFVQNGTSCHGVAATLEAWDEEDNVPADEIHPLPDQFSVQFIPWHFPGSQVKTIITIPIEYGDEIKNLIKVLDKAQKAYEAMELLAE